MPVVSVSLSETGYEGYVSIPKGERSRCINKLLKEYALKSNWTVRNGEHLTVNEVFERQRFMQQTIETAHKEIKALKKELKG